jgi:hypothetical protein
MFESINENKLLLGLLMIFVNIGSKFIVIELSETQKELLSNSILRQVLIFCVVFVGTRDIFISIVLTAVFVVLVDGLLHEGSPLSILPASIRPRVKAPPSDNGPFGQLRVMAGVPSSVQNPAYDLKEPPITVGVT